MAALSEKVLWPIVAIIIFGVLAFFYIDDRRSLAEHGGQTAESKQTNKEHAGEAAKNKQTSKEHGGQAAENKSAEKARIEARAKASSNKGAAKVNSTGATSMSMDEYLSESSGERSAELEANAAEHHGFSGSIDDYLSGKSTTAKNTQANSSKKTTNGNQASGATSMSMDEYQAKANGKASGDSSGTTQQASSNSGAFHGGIDDYLAKYGDGNQTAVNHSTEKPFNKKEHAGFHGSYEEYAKKYN